MGYFTNAIAKESRKPAIISLSGSPNYIQFERTGSQEADKPVSIKLAVINTSVSLKQTKIKMVETESEEEHTLEGTDDPTKVNNEFFYLDRNPAVTAENIKACLMKNDFFLKNFLISIPPVNTGSLLENGFTIEINSIGTGSHLAFRFEELDTSFIKCTGNPENTVNHDSIDEGAGSTTIEIEMYADTGVFMGADAFSAASLPLGNYIATTSKAYQHAPVWFNLNSLLDSSRLVSNSFPDHAGWAETGTVRDFRFIAKRNNGFNTVPFYISDVLYVVKGYGRNLENPGLQEYVYDTRRKNIVTPLSKQPVLFHTKGQAQYFNFLLADPDRNTSLGNNEYSIGILYRLYTQSGKHIADVQRHNQERKRFFIANTLKLDIDTLTEEYENTGQVKVYLHRAGKIISEPLKYSILPAYLYKVHDFVFLNSLGGWSSFNFPGAESEDFKATASTFYKTQTPEYGISSEIESVFSKEVSEKFSVQTMPVNEEVCHWLKELASSPAVYELSTKRYVLVDELNIKPNSKDELFRLEMKYHYSDKYNSYIV